jgi:phage/plasmid-associated DNA primase
MEAASYQATICGMAIKCQARPKDGEVPVAPGRILKKSDQSVQNVRRPTLIDRDVQIPETPVATPSLLGKEPVRTVKRPHLIDRDVHIPETPVQEAPRCAPLSDMDNYLLNGSPMSLCHFYKKIAGHHWKMCGKSNNHGYYWDSQELLWIRAKDMSSKLLYDISRKLTFHTDVLLLRINEGLKVSPESTKALHKLHRKAQGPTLGESVIKFVKSQIQDQEFVDKINNVFDYIAVKNGLLVNLRTGEARKRTAADFWDRTTAADYIADIDTSEVDEFMMNIALDDRALVRTLQMALGSALSGHNFDKLVWCLIGELRNNGKSTLLKIIRMVLGRFAGSSSEAFEAGRKTAAQAEILWMRFLRFVDSPETEHDLNESLIKKMIGGDSTGGRGNGDDDVINFTSQTKVFIVSNLAPKSTNQSFSAKICAIPFNCKFVKDEEALIEDGIRNPDSRVRTEADVFGDKLLDEKYRSAWLKWLVDGCILWYASKGTIMCDKVTVKTESVQQNANPVTNFLWSLYEDKGKKRGPTDDGLQTSKVRKEWCVGFRHLYHEWLVFTAQAQFCNELDAKGNLVNTLRILASKPTTEPAFQLKLRKELGDDRKSEDSEGSYYMGLKKREASASSSSEAPQPEASNQPESSEPSEQEIQIEQKKLIEHFRQYNASHSSLPQIEC